MRHFLKPISVSLIMCLTLSAQAMAQESGKRYFSSKTIALATEAKSNQAENAHKSAIKKLKKALKLKGLEPYETSAMYQMLAGSYYSTGKEEKAIKAFEDAIAAGGLYDNEVKAIQINIAQLNIAAKNYDVAASQLEAYFQQGGEQNAKLLKLVLLAHMREKNYTGALPWAEKMLDRGFVTTRPEYNNLLFLFNSPEKRAAQIRTANRMLQLWPEDVELKAQVDGLKRRAEYEAKTAG